MAAVLTGLRGHLVVLVCISLTAGEAEHLLVHLLATCRSCWKKCLYRSLTHFLIGLLVFFIVELDKFFADCYSD